MVFIVFGQYTCSLSRSVNLDVFRLIPGTFKFMENFIACLSDIIGAFQCISHSGIAFFHFLLQEFQLHLQVIDRSTRFGSIFEKFLFSACICPLGNPKSPAVIHKVYFSVLDSLQVFFVRISLIILNITWINTGFGYQVPNQTGCTLFRISRLLGEEFHCILGILLFVNIEIFYNSRRNSTFSKRCNGRSEHGSGSFEIPLHRKRDGRQEFSHRRCQMSEPFQCISDSISNGIPKGNMSFSGHAIDGFPYKFI